jgi:hypothetical protein
MNPALQTATLTAALVTCCMVSLCMIVFIVDTIIAMKKGIGKIYK